MNSKFYVVAAAVVLGAVPALAGSDPEFGATVRNNRDAQIINPNPNYAGLPPPSGNGKRSADAMIRYETGHLKPLLKTNGKTDVGGQGGADDAPTIMVPLLGTGSPN